jgi:hypothetical protein
MKFPLDKSNLVSIILYGLIVLVPFSSLEIQRAVVVFLASSAVGIICFSLGIRDVKRLYIMFGTTVFITGLFLLGYVDEGFRNKEPLKTKEAFKEEVYEGFNTRTEPKDIASLLKSMKKASSGFDTLEGFEDIKKEKDKSDSTPAPAMKKDALPQPFKLGEIPEQVKNGPHIDAGSTLMKAVKSLNPDQINAMTKDTQQLIETQKSLMGMLGTMKPMLNDGKQLMDTFQQMFGQ